MIRICLISIISVLSFHLQIKGQEKDVLRSLKLFKEGSELFSQGLRFDYDDTAKGTLLYRQAIEKFEEAYAADSTNVQLGIYLSEIYYRIANYQKALVWALKMQPYYAIGDSKVDSISRANNCKEIGFSYINLGNIEEGKKYLNMSLTFDSKYIFIVYHLIEIAKVISSRKNQDALKSQENSKLSQCDYAVSILNYGRTLCTKEESSFLFSKELFETIKSNCR